MVDERSDTQWTCSSCNAENGITGPSAECHSCGQPKPAAASLEEVAEDPAKEQQADDQPGEAPPSAPEGEGVPVPEE